MGISFSKFPSNGNYEYDSPNRPVVATGENDSLEVQIETIRDTEFKEDYIVVWKDSGVSITHRINPDSNNQKPNNISLKRYTDKYNNHYVLAVGSLGGVAVTHEPELPIIETQIYGFPLPFKNGTTGATTIIAYIVVTPQGVAMVQLFNGAGHAIDYQNSKDNADFNNHIIDIQPFGERRPEGNGSANVSDVISGGSVRSLNLSTAKFRSLKKEVPKFSTFSTTVDEIKKGNYPTVNVSDNDDKSEKE